MSCGHHQSTSPITRTGRKTLKYKRSEPVWSVDLEEALLQGLAEYRPSSTRDPSLLRRFPRRNKWISNYIFQRTGKTRTAKQVGSRLQQLRETCSDTEILGLIINKSFPSRSSQHSSCDGESSLPSTSTSNTPTSPSFPIIPPLAPLVSQNFVQVAVSLVLYEADPYYGSQNPTVTLDLDEHALSELTYPNINSFTHRADIRSAAHVFQSAPEIKLSSQLLQDMSRRYRSVSSVYCGNELVYSDESSHVYLQPAFFDENTQSLLYSHKLVPEFWSHMPSSPRDYCRYRVTQRIFSIDMHGTSHPDGQLLFCIDYSLECGAFPVAIDFDVQQQDLPPALVSSAFLPNYGHYSELPASDFDYSLLADQAVDTFTYPAYATYGIPTPQQSLQYTHL